MLLVQIFRVVKDTCIDDDDRKKIKNKKGANI